jgi:lysophospholipase L1-like esterase
MRPLTNSLAVALFALLAIPAAAEAAGYVGLGDSYAAGVGTGDYYPESGSCRRAPLSYPVLAAAELGTELSFTACSGASTAEVLDEQLWPLGESTAFVSVSAGGNDAGFASVIARCALPLPLVCTRALAGARRFAHRALPARLDALFAAIGDRAAAARVAVVGYPRLFGGRDCEPATFFSAAERSDLNRAANLLDRIERGEAGAYGFAFVDPRRAFSGHALCDPYPWLNGLSSPPVESFHPNPAGYRTYARLLLKAFSASD